MKKIFLAFALVVLLSITLAIAEVDENNLIRYGIIENDGSLTKTNTALTNASLIGFVCSDNQCNDVTANLFQGATLNSGSGSQIPITYSTSLQGSGYGLFYFKNNYIPYEVKATYAGNGQAPSNTVYLTQKRTCDLSIRNVVVNSNSTSGNIAFTIDSPIADSGPLNYHPSQISQHYSVNVKSTFTLNTLNGPTNYTDSKVISIPFSGSTNVTFSFPVSNGSYSIKVNSSALDDKCLASLESITTRSLNVTFPPINNSTNQTNNNQTNQTNNQTGFTPFLIIKPTPPFNVNNNGSQQTIFMNGTTSVSPLNISFILVNSTNSLMNQMNFNLLPAFNQTFPLNYIIPAGLKNGTYQLRLLTRGNLSFMNNTLVANVFVNIINNSINNTNQTNPGNQTNQTNNNSTNQTNNNPGHTGGNNPKNSDRSKTVRTYNYYPTNYTSTQTAPVYYEDEIQPVKKVEPKLNIAPFLWILLIVNVILVIVLLVIAFAKG